MIFVRSLIIHYPMEKMLMKFYLMKKKSGASCIGVYYLDHRKINTFYYQCYQYIYFRCKFHFQHNEYVFSLALSTSQLWKCVMNKSTNKQDIATHSLTPPPSHAEKNAMSNVHQCIHNSEFTLGKKLLLITFLQPPSTCLIMISHRITFHQLFNSLFTCVLARLMIV